MSYALEGSVVDTLNDYAAVRYTNVAFIALMIYDHIVTVDAEVSRIWTLRWSLPKVLFLINRYLVPPMLIFDTIIQTLFNLSEDTCAFVARWTAWPIIVSLGTVDWILLLRVFAISGHRPALRYILYIFFSISLAAWIALSALITARTHGTPGGAFFPGCLYSAPVYFYAAWIPGVVFESVIILLTLYYCYFYYSAKMVNPTLRVFARDSMLYFTAMFSFLLTNLFTARFGKDFLGSLFIVCVSRPPQQHASPPHA
ncbi:hypothetical protein MKEN_00969500 [Mycena kentingensis (nom. inval.)]|nr:hypothetical protein MKEN_00969500 [Mycena kentingensis (nom. inval.)]